ncbi:MAG: ABC transporter permease [Turicibacter sp.]|nr:ABC transporter permease [Turicibacter sp.]
MISILAARFRDYNFLFEELVKRDFKKRYKGTFLGILWSMLEPLLQLLVMVLVFTHFFGRDTPHFIVYVFSGLLVFGFFRDSTGQGMQSLMVNKGIFNKIKVPKYLFLFSKNVSSLINFWLTLVIFFIFVALDGIRFYPQFFLLIYPIITLTIFNIGVGLILSALFVFFKDIKYLYSIFTRMLMWLSAIFYTVDSFSIEVQRLFLLNPVFAHIHYFRLIVLFGQIPAWHIHLICAAYATTALGLGAWFYKKYNYRFVYYM